MTPCAPALDYDDLRARVFDRHAPGLVGAEHEAFVAEATRRRDEAAAYTALTRRGKRGEPRLVEERSIEVNPRTGQHVVHVVDTWPDGRPEPQRFRIVELPPGTSKPRQKTAEQERHTAILAADDELRALAWEAAGHGTMARLARQQLAERRAELGLTALPAE